MPQIIQSNIAALSISRHLETSQSERSQTLARLSSGLRINSARDDAAGLAISTRFTTQSRGISVAIRNANDAVSLLQTTDAALAKVTDALQRLRELGLQSANGVNSDSDRAALNNEAQQLIAEISRIDQTTSFNGQRLLDGSYDAQYQIGTEVGATLDVDLGRISADRLGRGADNGLAAYATDQAIRSGEFFINGVAIPGSSSSDDTSSSANASTSSIAKVAAINRVSTSTGVMASTVANVAAGTSQLASSTSGFVTLNGVNIDIRTGGLNLAADREAIVQAINQVQGRTGVVASDGGSSETGIILTAFDGRNIALSFSGTSETATGLPAAGVRTAGYTIRATDGASHINIASTTERGVPNSEASGIVSGRYEANLATYASQSRVIEFSANVSSLQSGALVLNGVAIGSARAEDDRASNGEPITSLVEGSGIATAAAINRQAEATGVSARVNPASVSGGESSFTMPAGLTGTVWVNGYETREIIGTGNRDTDRVQTIAAINELFGRTGAVASDNGNSITITTPDGRNLTVAVDHRGDSRFDAGIGLRATAIGIAAGDVSGGPFPANTIADTTYASVTLVSAGPIKIEAGNLGAAGLEDIAVDAGDHGGNLAGQFISDADISSVASAERLLGSVDNALDQINAERAKLGATQSRLDRIVANLGIQFENTSAANSRIQDADFAAESAQLARAEILQQAGITLLSQANAQPQLILSLLDG